MNYSLEAFASLFLFILLFVYTVFIIRKVCSKKYIDIVNMNNISNISVNNIEIV